MTETSIRFEPADENLNGYLEDTIVIDWQTPLVFEKAKALTEGCETVEARLEVLFRCVRDEIAHSLEIETDDLTCNASQVLREGHGLCYAKSHLLVAMIRFCGIPAGFCFQRLRSDADPNRFVLHGFVGVRLPEDGRWVALDPRGDTDAVKTVFDLERPSLAYEPDPELGEETLNEVYSKPIKHIVQLLEKAGSLERARRTLPDAV